MNAEEFEEIDFYFEQSLNLIIYSYIQIKRDKTEQPYSRCSIHKTTLSVRGSSSNHIEIEDYLRNDLINNYLKRLRHKFLLSNFSIQAGSEESQKNVKTGIVDIRFENISATSMDGTGFIFECKRLNKYADSLNAYIEDGMMRFVSGQYYPESGMIVAGMIAFVEVDLKKKPNGYLPVNELAILLQNKISLKKKNLRISHEFTQIRFPPKENREITNFNCIYLSKHCRPENRKQISIYHLLFDYYQILID